MGDTCLCCMSESDPKVNSSERRTCTSLTGEGSRDGQSKAIRLRSASLETQSIGVGEQLCRPEIMNSSPLAQTWGLILTGTQRFINRDQSENDQDIDGKDDLCGKILKAITQDSNSKSSRRFTRGECDIDIYWHDGC